MTKLEIINAKEVIDTYTKLPVSINTELKKAMRQGAKPSLANIKASLTQKEKRTIKAKVSGKGGINLLVGAFKNKKSAGIDPYMKLYWKEYGTLSNRSASHAFKKPRKPATLGWSGGITPRGQLDPLLDAAIPKIIDATRTILRDKNIKI